MSSLISKMKGSKPWPWLGFTLHCQGQDGVPLGALQLRARVQQWCRVLPTETSWLSLTSGDHKLVFLRHLRLIMLMNASKTERQEKPKIRPRLPPAEAWKLKYTSMVSWGSLFYESQSLRNFSSIRLNAKRLVLLCCYRRNRICSSLKILDYPSELITTNFTYCYYWQSSLSIPYEVVV